MGLEIYLKFIEMTEVETYVYSHYILYSTYSLSVDSTNTASVRKVLIVDDEAEIVSIFKMILEMNRRIYKPYICTVQLQT